MSEIPTDLLSFVIQFIHPEKTNIGPTGKTFDDAAIAAYFDTDVAIYRVIRDGFATNARRAAEELLADPIFAAQVDRLPFAPGSTVVGLGDSITDDYQSWLEILRNVFDLRRKADGVTFVNQGISGDTTGEVLKRINAVVMAAPAWVLCMIGTNDAWRNVLDDVKPNISPEESLHNLKAIRKVVTERTGARWLWITPATVLPEKMSAHIFMSMSGFSLSRVNEDLIAVGDQVRQMLDPVVDLQALLGMPVPANLLLSDGLHPSLEGQKVILRALVEKLAA